MKKRFYELASAGAVVFQNASQFTEVRLAGETRSALVGYCPDQAEELADIGRHIVSVDYPGCPADIRERILIESAACVRNGLDGEVPGMALLALSALLLKHEGRLPAPDAARPEATTIVIEDASAPGARIFARSPDDIMDLLGGLDGSIDYIFASEAKASHKDLTVRVGRGSGMVQALTIPARKTTRLIRKAEGELGTMPADTRLEYALASLASTISAYQQSLAGDKPGIPGSRWNWHLERERLAGLVAWVLREREVLTFALNNAEHIAIRITLPEASDGPIVIGLEEATTV